MPEITFCLFDLSYLFKLFEKKSSDINEKITEFEYDCQSIMSRNRTNLFGTI